MGKVKFGWAEIDITPTEKISLAGEFFERATNKVETPITMTALAIEADGEQAVFCSCDLVGIRPDLIEETRRKLNAPGLDPNKIIMNAIHTHNSYTVGAKPGTTESRNALQVLCGFLPEGCKYIPQVTSDDCLPPVKALDILSDKAAAVIAEAWAKRAEGGYANGFGRAAIGMCRRVCYSDGHALMWGDADRATFTQLEGGNDSGIELIFTYDADKKLTGVVANVACPSQVCEQRSFISSDYWGKVKILLREKYGKDLYVLGLCSAAGDQCPRDLVRWVEPETPIDDPNVIRKNPKYRRADPSMFDIKGSWTAGRRIVNEIDYAISEVTDIKTEAVFKHEAGKLSLPLRRVTDAEAVEAEKAIREFVKGRTEVNYVDTAMMHVYAGTLIRYEYQETHDDYTFEVHNLRFGDVAISTNPFELFLDYGNQIRARTPAAQTILIQLCCGGGGYLPTAKAEEGGHYSAYVSSGRVGHVGGEIYVRETLEAHRRLFKD